MAGDLKVLFVVDYQELLRLAKMFDTSEVQEVLQYVDSHDAVRNPSGKFREVRVFECGEGHRFTAFQADECPSCRAA